MVNTLWRDKTVTVSRRRHRILCGVRVTAQLPVIERIGRCWYLWLSYDDKVEGGTRLLLRPDGCIKRERVSHTGVVDESFEIAPGVSAKTEGQVRRRR